MLDDVEGLYVYRHWRCVWMVWASCPPPLSKDQGQAGTRRQILGEQQYRSSFAIYAQAGST
jgi:hypothetical protein